MPDISLPFSVVLIGIITGLTYGLLAMGLILIYQGARFINFAQGQLGVLSAVALAKLVIDYRMSYWLALPVAVAMSAGVGALVELTFVRRFFKAPRLTLTVVTIGIAQLLLALGAIEWLQPDPVRRIAEGYPVPFDVRWRIGTYLVRGPELMVLLVAPLAAAGLWALLRFSSYGRGIRAAAQNPNAARLAGVSVRRMSTMVWVIASVLSALAAVLAGPFQSTLNPQVLGPSLLIRALAVAVIAGLSGLQVAMVAGVALGVFESVVFWNFPTAGTNELAIFAVLIVALFVRARALAADGPVDDLAPTTSSPRPIPKRLRDLAWVRYFNVTCAVLGVAVAAAVPFLPGLGTPKLAFQLNVIAIYALVGLSLTIVIGWTGQISLGHAAFVGIGAYAATWLNGRGLPLPLLLVVAATVGGAVAVLIGIPALRIRRSMLAVATLAFAVGANGWLFPFVGGITGTRPGSPDVPGVGLVADQRTLYLVSLATLVACAVALRNFRRSGPGRLALAARDNELLLGSYGFSQNAVKVLAFGLSGAIAAIAGALLAFTQPVLTPDTFHPTISLVMLSMVIVGGLGSIVGPVLGSLFVFGIPLFFFEASPLARVAGTSVGVLWVLMYLPGGLVSGPHAAQNAFVRAVERRHDGTHRARRTLKERLTATLGERRPPEARRTESSVLP
ncbi:MAG: branched-chain amino acid ABC transporter permease [Microthrixaceae bacterium]